MIGAYVIAALVVGLVVFFIMAAIMSNVDGSAVVHRRVITIIAIVVWLAGTVVLSRFIPIIALWM